MLSLARCIDLYLMGCRFFLFLKRDLHLILTGNTDDFKYVRGMTREGKKEIAGRTFIFPLLSQLL